jgi:NADPH-dependent glutamate synthase beta subunit-like oxidoreductase
MVSVKSRELAHPATPVDDIPLTNGLAVDQFVSVGEAIKPTLESMGRPHVVVIGAGFGGLSTVKSLENADIDITLVDRRNHHLFVPLLYQVATAQLSPDHIAQPIRSILKKQKNVKVMFDEAVDIDVDGKSVTLASGFLLWARRVGRACPGPQEP